MSDRIISKLTHDERRQRRQAIADDVKRHKDVMGTARKFGVTPRTVRDACREFRVEPPPRLYGKVAAAAVA